MKLTPDEFRIKCGLVTVLLGLVLLALTYKDVNKYFWAGPFHFSYTERRSTNMVFAGGIFLIIVGAQLCFKFESDPPERKDPWENS